MFRSASLWMSPVSPEFLPSSLLPHYPCGHRKTDRVCYLIGHHHTYDQIDGIDYQILVEADFLVNLAEEQSSRETIESVKGKIFKTKTGIWLINKIF